LLHELVDRFALPPAAGERLQTLTALLAEDPAAATAVREPDEIVRDHLADALVALELEPVDVAASLADIGSGAGIPGLPLAIARPAAVVSLVEANRRKCAFLERAVALCHLANVSVVNDRAETWRSGLDRFEVVTARALAPLAVVVEYAAPLLIVGGHLVAWRGKRDPEAEAAAAAAAERLAMTSLDPFEVRPYRDARWRHLHMFEKRGPTPQGFPRRPGIARKRPLGSL
jgi:16S rRNA (guanine527-N7)-methyltransferase